MSVRHKTFQFRSRAHLLFAQRWLPAAYPRAVIIFIHSWSDHSGRYADVATQLAEAGYASYACDYEGHGQSVGERSQIRSFQSWVTDLENFIGAVQSEWRSVPMFLCGHGVGGGVAAHYLVAPHQGQEIDGVIFNASTLVLGPEVPKLKVWLAWFVGRLLPWLPIPTQFNGSLLSRDPAAAQAYEQDPLVHHQRMTAGTGRQLLMANIKAGKNLHRLQVPMLVLHGSADTLVTEAGSREVHEKAASIDKTLKIYDGALHDLFHDTCREQVISDIRDWLDARTRNNW